MAKLLTIARFAEMAELSEAEIDNSNVQHVPTRRATDVVGGNVMFVCNQWTFSFRTSRFNSKSTITR